MCMGIFQHDNVDRADVEKLVDAFPGQSIDFFGAIRARVYDDKVRAVVWCALCGAWCTRRVCGVGCMGWCRVVLGVRCALRVVRPRPVRCVWCWVVLGAAGTWRWWCSELLVLGFAFAFTVTFTFASTSPLPPPHPPTRCTTGSWARAWRTSASG